MSHVGLGDDRSARLERFAMWVCACLLLGGYAMLRSQESVLSAMAYGACAAGGPAALQGGPGGADDSEAAEIVTGWYLAVRAESALQANPAAEIPTACAEPVVSTTITGEGAGTTSTSPASTPSSTTGPSDGSTPSTSPPVTVPEDFAPPEVSVPSAGPGLDVGLHVATSWLVADMVGFAPVYGALLTFVVLVVRRSRRRTSAGSIGGYAARLASHHVWLISLIWLGVLCDIDENRLLWGRLHAWWDALAAKPAANPLAVSLTGGDLDRFAVWCMGWLKFVALVPAMFVAIVGLVHAAGPAWKRFVRAVPELWVQLLALVVFAVVWMGPLDQGVDAIRRLSTRQWIVTSIAIALLAAVLALTGSRSLRYVVRNEPDEPHEPVEPVAPGEIGESRQPGGPVVAAPVDATPVDRWRRLGHRPSGWILSGVGALLVWGLPRIAATDHLRGLPYLGWIVLVVGVTSLLLDLFSVVTGTPGTAEPTGDERRRSACRLAAAQLVAPVLAGLLFLVFGVATIAATAGDLAYAGAGTGGTRVGRMIAGYAFVLAAPFATWGARWLVGAVTGLGRGRVVVLAALALTFGLGVLLHSPALNLRFADDVGTVVVLCVFLGGFVLIGSIADQLTQRLVAGPKPNGPRGAWRAWLRQVVAHLALPSSLRLLRFRSTPVFEILVVWAVLATGAHLDGYHSIRRLETSPATPLGPDDVARHWIARQQTAGQQTGGATSPAMLVAASGGGIRAAFWTAQVLDCLIERNTVGADPCGEPAEAAVAVRRRRALLLMSGASGGSLGLAEYVASVGEGWAVDGATAGANTPLPSGWVGEALGSDFLAPLAATWWFTDGVNTFLRPDQGVDRGAMLERAWEHANGSMRAPFFAGQAAGAQPILLMNGYSAQTGCRVLTSVLRLSSSGPGADCSAPAATTTSHDAAEAGSTAGSDSFALPATLDLRSFCEHADIRFSTAAMNSARFPVVSPAGHLDACRADGTRLDPSPSAEIVDGGYRENTGASTIVEAWPQLRAALEEAMAGGTVGCIAPIFLQIDNGYHDRSPTAASDTRSTGVLTPVIAQLHLSKGIEATAQQRAYELFSRPAGSTQLWFHIQTFAHPGAAAPLGWVLSDEAKADLIAQLSGNAVAFEGIRTLLDDPSLLPCLVAPTTP